MKPVSQEAQKSPALKSVDNDSTPARPARSANWLARLTAYTAVWHGVTLLFLSIFMETLAPTDWPHFVQAIYHSTSKFFEVLGATWVAVAAITIMIDLEHWREYFSSRLQDIVVKQDYLSRLDKGTLKELQRRIMKQYYPDGGADSEGSLLNHIDREFHPLVTSPYREDFSMVMELLEDTIEGTKVRMTITYILRSIADGGKRIIPWAWMPEETSRVFSLSISCQRSDSPESHSVHDMKERGDGGMVVEKEKLEEFEVPSEQWSEGMRVVIKTCYISKKDNVCRWIALGPTLGFEVLVLSATGPREITITPFVAMPDIVNFTQLSNGMRMLYHSWVLPGNGAAWMYSRIDRDEGALSGDASR